MAEAEIPKDKPAENAIEARQKAAEYQHEKPIESETHGMEREPGPAPLGEEIRARVTHPHKGDVGRPGTNEEIYQGSKQKELNS